MSISLRAMRDTSHHLDPHTRCQSLRRKMASGPPPINLATHLEWWPSVVLGSAVDSRWSGWIQRLLCRKRAVLTAHGSLGNSQNCAWAGAAQQALAADASIACFSNIFHTV